MTSSPAAPRYTTTVGIVFLVLFLDCVVFGMLFPLVKEMMVFYREHDTGGVFAWALGLAARMAPGSSDVQHLALFGGLVIGLYSLMTFLTAPLWGRISDRIGRRPVLLIGLSGTVIANAVWAVSPSFLALIASRLFAGALSGSVVVANAAIGDITTPERRARAMGMVGMAFGLGFVLGPAIGALSYHPQVLRDIGPFHDFSLPALCACGLAIANLLWAFARFRETLPVERRGAPSVAGRTANPLALFNPRNGVQVARINMVFCLYTLLFSGMEATLVFLTADRCGFTPQGNAWLFLTMGLVTALMQGAVFRPLAPRWGVRRMGILGLSMSVPGFLLLGCVGMTGHAWALWCGAVCLSIGSGLSFPALSTLASLSAGASDQGAVMGTFRSAGSLGRALGPYVGAIAYFSISAAAPYVIGACGMLIPLTICWLLLRPSETVPAAR